MRKIVMVFARAPVPGACKTRLIPRYGPRGAARLHRQLATRTLASARDSGAEVELWCAPGPGHGWFQRCRRTVGVALRRQHSGDLGRRMALALADALRRAPRAVIVGTDCPALSAQDLHSALEALHTNDAVLQPAHDGGYVLIGARRGARVALRGIAWSSGRELAQTRAQFARLGLDCALLAPRADVDVAADARAARTAGLLPAGSPWREDFQSAANPAK